MYENPVGHGPLPPLPTPMGGSKVPTSGKKDRKISLLKGH